MRPCLECYTPTEDTRCGRCRRTPGRKRFYGRSAYRAYRRWVQQTHPPCAICGMPDADTVDHRIPLALGGTNERANLRPVHSSCNYRRGAGV